MKAALLKHKMGAFGALVVFLFVLAAIYAPFLASSKPIVVDYDGQIYFPLFRYLFYQGFYSKPLDLFFNVLMITFPFFLLFRTKLAWLVLVLIQIGAFFYVTTVGVRNPANEHRGTEENAYTKLNRALKSSPTDPLIRWKWMPFISEYHWEEDPGEGVTGYTARINGKDLTAALIFGTRISLVVGILACGIALLIGLPIGAYAGYHGGTFDLVVCRLIEIWESMPAFFMLLFAVAILQSKSIFIVITLIALFGWTGFSRYMRGECLKQRALAYVEAGRAIGYSDAQLLFSEILPNAIPPIITLLPFAIMGAISSEAGLSFLGLGEEGSTSWGVLMDEGRSAFPTRAYLLWPPAILLTILLVAIALIGDALRDALDPQSQ